MIFKQKALYFIENSNFDFLLNLSINLFVPNFFLYSYTVRAIFSYLLYFLV